MNDLIVLNSMDRRFADQISLRSGTNVNRCYHCRCCASGCPFIMAMDFPPNAVIRLVQLGLRKEALECSTIWTCVGCHTCSVQCPMAIDMAAIMDALRQTALAEGVSVPEPDVLDFHKEVLNSIERYGRTHKLEIMLRYKLKTRNLFSDLDVGLKMLSKRKLDLMPSKIEHIEEVQKLFRKK